MAEQPKPLGRPKLPEGTARPVVIQVRLSDAEAQSLRLAAKEADQATSTWARSVLLRALKKPHGKKTT